jgi:hypothetical protein
LKQEEEAAKGSTGDSTRPKQMGSLCAVFMARNLLAQVSGEVCESIQPANLSGQHLEAGKDCHQT